MNQSHMWALIANGKIGYKYNTSSYVWISNPIYPMFRYPINNT